jgi:hypothetical protein
MSSDANHRNPHHPAGSRSRPALTTDLSATEFGRWHWWKDELDDFCRSQALAVSGTKSMLIDRISDHLTEHSFELIAGANPPAPESADRSLAPSPSPAEPPPDAVSIGGLAAEQPYLAFSRRYFDDHPDATLREAWRSFKWARASGRVPVGAS